MTSAFMGRSDAATIGRIGGLAAALGIGFAVLGGGTGTASADTDSTSSSASASGTSAQSGPRASKRLSSRQHADARTSDTARTPKRPLRSVPDRLEKRRAAASNQSAAATETVEVPAVSALRRPIRPAAPTAPANPAMWTLVGAFAREADHTWFNHRPALDDQQVAVSLDTPEDVSDPITLGGTDPDGDALRYTVPRVKVFGGAAHGTVTVDQASGTVVYNPDDAFALSGGNDRFLVKASDLGAGFHLHGLNIFGGHTAYAWVTVTVDVAPSNRAPVATANTTIVARTV